MMYFLNATNVLTNRVNCFGTFILTLFWRILRDLRALLFLKGGGGRIHFEKYDNYDYEILSPSYIIIKVISLQKG